MENSEIGLIIWGCKGGYRVFCSNNVVDYGSTIIKDTIKDIRPFIRFVKNSLNIYALEFTAQYKIYTLYRSCRDSGNGAYVAITIYVPHTLQVDNIRDILCQMMDSYFSEYVDPYGNFFPGKYDDIRPFASVLKKLATPVNVQKKFNVRRSDQDDIPKLWLYEDIKEVESFFASPYRQEFYRCQEVMFIASDLYNQMPNTFNILKETKVIQAVSEQEPLPELTLSDFVDNIKSFKINKESCDVSKSIQICDSDEVSIEFVRPYCEVETIEGDVKKLKEQALLYVRGNKLLLNADKIPTTYKEYSFKVRLNGIDVPDNKVKISFDCRKWEDIMSSMFSVKGNFLRNKLYWSILLSDGKYIGSSNPIDLTSYIGSKNIIDLKSDVYNYKVNVGNVGNVKVLLLKIIIKNINIDFKLPSNKETSIQFELPNNFCSEDLFQFRTNERAIVNVNNRIIEISPKSFEYKLKIPYVNISDEDWDFSVNAESRKLKGGKIKLNPSEDVRKGILTIDSYRFYFDVNDNNDILPQGVIVIPPSEIGIGVIYRENNLVRFQNFILPTRPKFMEPDKFSFTETNENGIEIIRVTPIMPHTNINEGSNFNNILAVNFINCKGFEIVSNDQTIGKLPKNETWDLKNHDRIKIVKNNCECIILKDCEEYKRSPQINDENKKNGFEVIYSEDGLSCKISYKKNSGIIKYWVGAAIVLFIIFVGVVYNALSTGKKYEAIYISMIVNNTEEINELKSIKSITSSEESMIYTKTKDTSQFVILFNERIYEEYKENLQTYVDALCNVGLKLSWANDYTEEWNLQENRTQIEENLSKFLKDKDKQSIKMTIEITPEITNELRSLVNDSIADHDFYAQANKLSELAPITVPYLKTACWNKIDTTDIQSLATYKDVIQRNSPLYDNKVESILNNRKKEEELEAKRQQEQNDIRNEAASKKDLLWRLDCTSETVASVETWWKNNKNKQAQYKDAGYDFDKYIKAYKMFFEAESLDDMNTLHNKYKKYFSEEQHRVIYTGYGNPANFNNWKNTMGMSFRKPYTMGALQ